MWWSLIRIVDVFSRRPFLFPEYVTIALRCSVKQRWISQGRPSKAVPEWARSRAPLPPEGTPLQQTGTWSSPPTDPPDEVDEMEKDATSDLVFGANHAWNLRERVMIREMEDYLTKRSAEILMEVGELEAYLLCPTDVTGIVDVGAQKVCFRQNQRRTFGGNVRQYAIMRGRMDTDYQGLQEIIEYMNVKQKGLFEHHGTKAKIDERSTGENSGENSFRKPWFQRTGFWRRSSCSRKGKKLRRS